MPIDRGRGRRIIVQLGRSSCARARPGGRLAPPARAAIEALAIIGRPADELVGAVAGLDGEAVGPALSDAIRGGVAAMPGNGLTSGTRSSARSSPGPCPRPRPAGSSSGG